MAVAGATMAQAAASSLRWAAMLFYVYMMTHLFALVCAAVFAIFCESAAEVRTSCRARRQRRA